MTVIVTEDHVRESIRLTNESFSSGGYSNGVGCTCPVAVALNAATGRKWRVGVISAEVVGAAYNTEFSDEVVAFISKVDRNWARLELEGGMEVLDLPFTFEFPSVHEEKP